MKALTLLVVAAFAVLAATVAKLSADLTDRVDWEQHADTRLRDLERSRSSRRYDVAGTAVAFGTAPSGPGIYGTYGHFTPPRTAP